MNFKKVFLGCLAATGIFIVAYILCAVIALAFMLNRDWFPFMDDGPFHGEKRLDCPTTKPNQKFQIWNELILNVYDKKKKDINEAPTVSLQNKGGKTLWCVYAIGNEGTYVKEIRFTDYKSGFPIGPKVRGQVTWTYGKEVTWWYIDKKGNLDEYWYSW